MMHAGSPAWPATWPVLWGSGSLTSLFWEDHLKEVDRVVFARSGHLIASGSSDGTTPYRAANTDLLSDVWTVTLVEWNR